MIDEIKGVFKDLKRLKEPQLLHLAQAKCYAYIYAEQKNLEEIGVQMTYCNLDTEEIRRFQEVYTRAELKKWFEELVSEYENGQDTRWNGEPREMLQSKQWNSHSNIETDRRNWLRRYTGQF